MTEIYWFRSDLRTNDNPALQFHCDAEKLLCVYFWPREIPWCNLKGLGGQRERFLIESLDALSVELAEHGQRLFVYRESPAQVLPALVDRYKAVRIGVARSAGSYERGDEQEVSARVSVPVVVHEGNTLFSEGALQSANAPLKQFTPFRLSIEHLEARLPAGRPVMPPSPGSQNSGSLPMPRVQPNPSFSARGGAKAGEARLKVWMHRERSVASYKETRNQLDGLFYSSFLSPWLANGSLSIRKVAWELDQFERLHGENDSTRHFFSELLWREFFYQRAIADGASLFRVRGTGGSGNW